MVEAAKRCGIISPLEANASLALGTSEVTPLELTSAYAAFASGGIKVEPYLVTEVDSAGGRPIYKRKPADEPRVIASHVDHDLTAMMFGVMTEGTGRGAALWDREAAGKTGTTQDYHDAWFVGFTTDYVAGVWVGNDDSSPMRGVTGGSLPAEIWREVMTAAEKGLPAKPLDRSPPGLPIDETLSASGVSASGDDESNNAPIVLIPPGSAQQQQQQTHERRNFWDWLFGPGEDKKPAQSPPAQDDEGGGGN